MVSKAELLAAFENYLEAAPAVSNAGPDVGLAQLFAELAALKTEVRAEARQFKGVLEDFRGALASHHQERERHNEALRQAHRQALQPLLLELLELRDRQQAGLQALERLRPGFFKRLLFKRKRLLYQSIHGGHQLTLARFDQMLASHGVIPMQTEGRPFDPALMRVAEVVQRKHLDSGVVTAELRRGYLWHGQVLRLAEVEVNQLEGT